MLLFGTDEAGYGPNLGPLVVSASVWSVPDADLSELGEVLKKQGIDIADSKKLYHGGGSLAALELGVWIAFFSADKTKISVEMSSDDPCWQDGFFHAPVSDLDRRELEDLAEIFRTTLDSFDIRLLRIQSLVVGAEAFNRRLDACDSKGTLLSEATLGLIGEVLESVAPEYRLNGEKILVLCDKHGGRNRYLDVLNQFFSDDFFQVVEESRPLSVYRSADQEFRFQSKGESQLPVALASMFSKYLRELSMLSFNVFWRSRVPDLKPTAGYPEDAKRFKAAIAAAQTELGLAENRLWRKK